MSAGEGPGEAAEGPGEAAEGPGEAAESAGGRAVWREELTVIASFLV
jgi:hypothetical protein